MKGFISRLRFVAVGLAVAWVVALGLWAFTACRGPHGEALPLGVSATDAVFPYDTDSICIPSNIAPLNFCLRPASGWSQAQVRMCFFNREGASVASFAVPMGKNGSRIPLKKWRKALQKAAGGQILVEVSAVKEGVLYRLEPLHWFVSQDAIDPYLLFRASQYEEGEHGWVFLRQRRLTDFETRQVLDNRLMDKNCMNCHDCYDHRASHMVVHLREAHKGTLLINGKEARKIQVPANYQIRLTYPAWHPSGRYVAFSTNLPHSVHYANATHKIIYTLDTLSDIVVLDVENMRLFSCPELTREEDEAVFPTWSRDGKRLYFCVSPHKRYDSLPYPQYADTSLGFRQNRVEQVWADLMQMDFDPETERFSNFACTYPFSQMQKSACMPKLSPDGKYMVVSLLKASTFPLQNLGDFYRLNLQDSTVEELCELNTEGSEKGHSFSSSGKWMVFSSSRRTLAIPETYITHYDSVSGHFSRPFLVPQKWGDFYLTNLRGFVFPVLSTEPAALQARALAGVAREEAMDLQIDTSLEGFRITDEELEAGTVQFVGGH